MSPLGRFAFYSLQAKPSPVEEEVKRAISELGITKFIMFRAGAFLNLTVALNLLARRKGKVLVVVSPEREEDARKMYKEMAMSGLTPVVLISQSLTEDEVLVGF